MLKTDLRHIDLDLINHILRYLNDPTNDRHEEYLIEYNGMLIKLSTRRHVLGGLAGEICDLKYPCITVETTQECAYCGKLTRADDIIVIKNGTALDCVCVACCSKIHQIRKSKCSYGLNYVNNGYAVYEYDRIHPIEYEHYSSDQPVLQADIRGDSSEYCNNAMKLLYKHYVAYIARRHWVVLCIDLPRDIIAYICTLITN